MNAPLCKDPDAHPGAAPISTFGRIRGINKVLSQALLAGSRLLRLVIGSDHAGFELKQVVAEHLRTGRGHEIQDVGSHSADPVDFPDIARALTGLIISGQAERGLMVCGTGVGAAIAANKMRGIRAAVLHDLHSAHQAVEHDDVNVMCLGAQIVGPWLALDLIDTYLAARFSTSPEFRRRVAKLAEMENE